MPHKPHPKKTPVILTVDDDDTLREIISLYLEQWGWESKQAANGWEALRLFQETHPDMVLLDASMPGMDGFETCSKLKRLPSGAKTPIIMVTGLSDDTSVDRAFASGADEYITKPIHWAVLRHRIRHTLTHRKMAEEVRSHRDRLAYEKGFIEAIITRMRTSKQFNTRNLRFLEIPIEQITGDLLLSAIRPDGGQSVLLGDFTGHGLPAGVGGPLVSDIFYAMTAKGFHAEPIMTEINQAIYSKMPTGIFMVACFLELDPTRRTLVHYNCGMPDMLVFRSNKLWKRIPSEFFPRGIVDQPDPPGPLLPVEPGDRIFALSDGIEEQKNSDGEFFGQPAVETLLADVCRSDKPLASLTRVLERFRAGEDRTDDQTLLELTC